MPWTLIYTPPPPGTPSPLTTKGDLWGFDTADNRVPVGVIDGYVLTVDSSAALGVSWQVGTPGPTGPTGPTGATGSGPSIQTLTNGESSSSHVLGTVVYLSGADTVQMADATDEIKARAVAFATGTITHGSTGDYQFDGPLAGLSGLTPEAIYYVDPATPGAITTTPSLTPGNVLTEVGFAQSTTVLFIRIRQEILL